MEGKFNTIFNNIKYCIKKYFIFILYLILGLITTFLVEALGRGSIKSTIEFFINSIDIFIVNYLIVLLFLSPMIIFKKLFTMFGVILCFLLTLSGISFFILKFRGYPMTFSDIYIVKDGLSIAGEYINLKYIFILLFIIALIYISFKGLLKADKKYSFKVKFVYRIIPIVIILITLFSYINSLKSEGKLKLQPINIKLSYTENGFLYSYFNSYTQFLKSKPNNYTQENILEIKSKLEKEEYKDNFNIKPNIIFLQLEAVMDLSNMKDLCLTGDPLTNFNKLSQEYTSGILNVPTFGGGTVRTEFEILTGYSNDYLSPGEIAYTTILKQKKVDSIASYLNNYGYEGTMIHNYRGNFYDRDTVAKNLGFKRFIPLEYMYNTEDHPNYPKDFLLLANIRKVLAENNNPKFIYGIGVQTHGPYNSSYSNTNNTIKVTGEMSDEARKEAQDYVDRLVEVDTFLGNLVKYLEKLNEPVVLVVFSDHLTTLKEVTEKYINDDNKFKTRYFIYDNIGLPKSDEEIEAYELSGKVFDLLGINGNKINQINKLYKNNKDYYTIAELAQYDLLYGKKYLLDRESKFYNQEYTMGIEEISINKVIINENYVEVKGKFFNQFSVIYADGKKLDTEYINSGTLRFNGNFKNVKSIKVKQLGMYGKVLGETDSYILNEN